MSLQLSAWSQSCQPTRISPRNGSTVIVPVRKRSSVSFATGWMSSGPGPGLVGARSPVSKVELAVTRARVQAGQVGRFYHWGMTGAATAASGSETAGARTLSNYVGGAWAEPIASATQESRNPASGELLAQVP